MHKFEKAV